MFRVMARMRRGVCGVLLTAMVWGACGTPALAGDWLARVRGKWQGHKGIPSAEALAAEIDGLEKHLNWYGSIVAKQPDVWGQARLMKFRQEFEKTLLAKLGTFDSTLQASISRTDQAFLAQALSLSAAISGAPATLLPPSAATSREVVSRRRAALKAAGVSNPTPAQLGADTSTPTIPTPTTNPAAGLIDAEDTITQNDVKTTPATFAAGRTVSLEPTVLLDQLSRFVNHLHELRRINEGDDTADSPGYALHLVRIPVSILPGTHTRKGFGAEVTVTATPQLGRDLLPATFRNLVANDLVEQISTPLVEFFNSKTSLERFVDLRNGRIGGVKDVMKYGLPAPLLGAAPPSAATSHVTNASQIRPRPVASRGSTGGMDSNIRRTAGAPSQVPVPPASARPMAPPAYDIPPPESPLDLQPIDAAPRSDARLPNIPALVTPSPAPGFANPPAIVAPAAPPAGQPIIVAPAPVAGAAAFSVGTDQADAIYNRGFRQAYEGASSMGSLSERMRSTSASASARRSLVPEALDPIPTTDAVDDYDFVRSVRSEAGAIFGTAAGLTVPASRSRNARYAFPTSQLPEVYGMELIMPVAFAAFDGMVRKPVENGDEPTALPPHRVMAYIQDQVVAAQDFLARPENLRLWQNFATPELASAVRGRDVAAIRSFRNAFLASLPNAGLQDDLPYGPRYTTLAAFAWAVIVESVLLNERLIQDIGEAATAKGGLPPVPGDQMFFLPCPSDESRDAFNQYVRTRFPIHVFAVDPVNQEQNIADDLSRTRELQLALSMAFVTGNISASSMTRYARRLELQTETVALNRTQIAFSHGEDTFGWRFQPRYQTPPTQGNLTVAFRDSLLGGPTREQDRRQLELEPGMRECVAIVIMPSFVPYVTFETRTNWYRLNSPKHSEIDAAKFLGLSASIKRAYTLAQNLCDAGLYRDGDVNLLINRVKQLAARLPMQSMIAQMPFENTNGGFELFNVGVTDLAPELRSWYGAPGISLDNGASLFLVGDNFSVNQTSVVVGNKTLGPDDFQLLSRQVMRVSVPPGSHQVIHGGKRAVEASVATPYGVSQSLYIPVYTGPKDPDAAPPANAPTYSWAPESFTLGFNYEGLGIATIPNQAQRPEDALVIKLDSGVPLAPTVADVTLLFEKEDPKAKVARIVLAAIPYDNRLGGFVIKGDALKCLSDSLFEEWHDRFSRQAPPRDVVVTRTILSLKGSPAAPPVVPQDVRNALTIKWQEVPKR